MPNKYKYKNSNVPWIGAIPEHWEIMKGKHIFKIYGNSIDENNIYTNFKDKSKLIYYYKVDDMNYDKNSLIMSSKIEPKYTDVIVPAIPKYSILIPKRGAAIATNKVKISLNKCYIDSNIMALYTNFNSKFYSYFLYARGLWDIADVSSVPQINNKHINFLEFVLPAINEQNKIANYLDKKTAKIDATISKNKQLIDLLEEKRVALINQVVTKGLNPEVPMKDSGIEWMGEISEHWDVDKLKKYFFIHNGSTPKDSEENWGGNICWITPADYKTNDVYINESSRQITKIGLNSCGTTLVPKGSIIVSNRAPIGTVAIANTDLCTNQGCKSLSIKREINTKFVYYILSINQKELNMLGRGTTFMELSSYDLGTFQIPIAPISEQINIVNYLDNETSKITETIIKIEENINLLDEYKTSLIHHVVTGKIDVRGEEI